MDNYTGTYNLTFEESGDLDCYISRPLLDMHKILVAFTTRRGGVSPEPYTSLNLAFHVGDDKKNVVENREILCGHFGVDPSRMVCAEQVHGASVSVVGEAEAGRGALSLEDSIPGVDALITGDQSIPLALFFADCVPVVLVEPHKRVVSVVHAGWRGIYGGVIESSLRLMRATQEIRPEGLVAFIGPSIGGCCFKVGLDLAEKFSQMFKPDKSWLGENTIHLRELARLQLIQSGVRPGLVYECDTCCTSCNNDRFFSYRADGGRTGRQAAMAAVLPRPGS